MKICKFYRNLKDKNGREEKKKGNYKQNIPDASTSLASLIASEVAMSWLAGDIARIMQLGCKGTHDTNSHFVLIYSQLKQQQSTNKIYFRNQHSKWRGE